MSGHGHGNEYEHRHDLELEHRAHCDCGQHYDHEYCQCNGHGNDHGHGHEHKHEHGQEKSAQLIHAHDHSNDPAIFSETHQLELTYGVSSDLIQQALSEWMEAVQQWAKTNFYLVGHIKVFVEGPENLWLSSTGRNINVKQSAGWSEQTIDHATINATAIILRTSKVVLEEYAREKLQESLRLIR